ncbi:MAG TPA: tetratricopeptide repeat protein [Candidatus Acidoferrum sp.]|jgi:tetratricopeptide (TPR) repeat protein|nr:tetratricopeptide repeat protein [Candidatus Acidoferrum sp.]
MMMYGCGSVRLRVRLLTGLLVLCGILQARGAEFKEAQQRFLAGDYARAVTLAQKTLADRPDDEDWQLLLSDALLATGRYPEAQTAITNALARNRWSVRLCWQAREVFLGNGQTEAAKELPDRIIGMVSRNPRDFNDAASLVVFGRAVLQTGADPKRVLDNVFDAARKADPKLRDVYLASGGLALDKHDFALAAKKFEEGLKQLPDDPDLNCGLSQAYAPSDTALMLASLETALKHNSNHVACLLLLVDHAIDAEDYEESSNLLNRVEAVNPWQPDAWAYRAVLAKLQNQPEAEQTARQKALKFWPDNPRVDYLIGLKLSQQYRFEEGSAHQRQALRFSPDYMPAKAQLAQDLLRLGAEVEGWKLAEEVQKQDAYDVEAYNLSLLHDTMAKFATLTNRNFILRISRHEAEVYGARVLDLLERARSNLCAKYGMELQQPTIVEVFPEQKDFAVRTFGMPGNPGYLGVCFGKVITANSPAAQPGHAINWEAVLWHEFCHVVTLQMTHNKMPRWLSEGISVYEERQANPAWGEHMNPDYRRMALGDELTPVSELSGAFLAPRSALHLQFAYYESSLVVEFLVQQFGLNQLQAVLYDLGEGVEINTAIEKHTVTMQKLEEDFAAFARQKAEQLAPGLDWTKPGPEGPSKSATNFYSLTELAVKSLEDKEFEAAKTPLQELIKLYPSQTGAESAWAMLAAAHRGLGETNAERHVLIRLADQDGEALEAYRRLMELGAGAKDWPAVSLNAQRYLAVDPLVALPYRFLAQACERTGETDTALSAYRATLALEPPDPAELHFKLARLLHQAGSPEARRQVLQALEEAPRYREALRLLLEIENSNGTEPSGT